MVILLLGTNLGDREKHLDDARGQLKDLIGPIKRQSPVYQTEPWGLNTQPDFLNQLIFVETDLPPQKVLKCILIIEQKIGRIRSRERYASRIIDIDIIFYKNLILNTDDLIIPHPQLHKRRFVLVPLADMIPEFIHPVIGKSMEQLLKECSDKSGVALYKQNNRSGEQEASKEWSGK